MGSRRKLVVLAVLPAALVATLIFLSARPPASPRPDRPEERDDRHTETSPRDAAPDPSGPGSRIEGVVVRRGHGVQARVEARLAEGFGRGPVAAATKAGGDGRFRLPDLPPGRYEFRAVTTDRIEGEAFAVVPAPGAHVQVRIEIPVGEFSLSGRAIWADGRPFRGFVRGAAWTETGRDGRFRIRGLEQGAHPLVFLLPGVYRSRGHHAVIPADREQVFVVDEGAIGLSGRVVDAESRAPIEGALVEANGGQVLFEATSEHRVQTDAGGRFHVRVPLTYRTLQLSAAGYRPCRYAYPWETEGVEIAMDRAHRATGRVETVKGEPVAGVVVHADPASIHEQAPPARALSGADGRFRLDVAVESVILRARGAGWVSKDLGRSLLGINPSLARTLGRGSIAEIRLVVERSATVEGRVSDTAGQPVVGAIVRVRPQVGRSVPHQFLSTLVEETATGPDGRFLLADCLPGVDNVLDVTAPGFRRTLSPMPHTPPGGRAEVEIVLAPGAGLQVFAVMAGGDEPVSGATIEIATERGPTFTVIASRVTDEEGRATVEGLAPGLIRVRGRHADCVHPGPSVSVTGAVPGYDVRLSFKAGRSVAGRVRFADGTPAPHGRVNSWPVTSRGYPDGRRYSLIAAGGMFRILGHFSGRHRLEADAIRDGRRHVGSVFAEAGREDVEIVLAPEPAPQADGPVVEVRVLDPEGRPVPYADVGYVELDGRTNDPSRSWYRAYLGRATIELEASTERFWLYVRGARSLSKVPLPFGPVLLGPLSPDGGEIEVRLPPERELSGLVLDGEGRRVPGAIVGCFPLRDDGSAFDGPGHNVYSDDLGRFQIGGLGDGEYIVRASRRGLGKTETVARGGAGNLSLVLEQGLAAVILVIDAYGRPVSGAEVRVGHRWGTTSGNTRADGRIAFTGIPLKPPFALTVLPSPRRPGASIDPWTPRDTTVRLPEALTIAGRVIDAAGKPVPDVYVWFRHEGRDWYDSSVEEDGSFSIGGVPSGEVKLLALPEDVPPTDADTRAILVAAGKKDVRLVYRPGAVLRIRFREWPAEEPFEGADLLTASGELVGEGYVDEKGELDFGALDERGVYTLFVPPLDDGRTLYRTGLRPGPDRIALSLEPGGLIRGTLLRPVPVEDIDLWLEGPGIQIEAVLFPDGVFEIAGVPSGTFTVVADGWRSGKWIRASARASRGDTVTLILKEDE